MNASVPFEHQPDVLHNLGQLLRRKTYSDWEDNQLDFAKASRKFNLLQGLLETAQSDSYSGE